jgi:hypothetical protein
MKPGRQNKTVAKFYEKFMQIPWEKRIIDLDKEMDLFLALDPHLTVKMQQVRRKKDGLGYFFSLQINEKWCCQDLEYLFVTLIMHIFDYPLSKQ